jgi:hypothetical protein
MDHRTNRARYEAQLAAVSDAAAKSAPAPESAAGESQAENPAAGE